MAMHRQEFVPELRREIAQSLGDACLVLFPAAWLVLLTQAPEVFETTPHAQEMNDIEKCIVNIFQ